MQKEKKELKILCRPYLSEPPSLVLVKSRKDLNNASCRRDMIEIVLKAA